MSKANINELEVNGVVYVPKNTVNTPVINTEGLIYTMVRTCTAGVFAGYVKERNGQEATLLNARRIWYWEGASSLSELATEGTSKPDKCKFPIEVSEVTLTEVIELIPITEKAKQSIDGVKVWTQH
jgi:hypothetical protein